MLMILLKEIKVYTHYFVLDTDFNFVCDWLYL